MNEVILIGRLTSDPEIRQVNETKIAKFRIAVDRPKKGEQEEADFIRVVAFGKIAETVEKYCFKGKQIGIIGRLRVETYEDRDGNKRSSAEVVVRNLELLASPRNNDEQRNEDTSDLPDFSELGDIDFDVGPFSAPPF